MNLSEIKKKVKKNISTNTKGLFLGTLIIPIYLIVSMGTGLTYTGSLYENPMLNNGFSIVSLVLSALILTVSLLGISLARNETDYKSVNKDKNLYGMSTVSDFIDIVAMNLLIFIFVFLWSLLFVIPGIIKSYSYSQAIFIYFDRKREGAPITYLEAITQSRMLMNGHKFEYFSLQLSFILYWILIIILGGIGSSIITFGIFGLTIGLLLCIISLGIAWWLMLYITFVNTEYYVNLKRFN